MSQEEERVKRLQARFELIRAAIAVKQGTNFALSVACGAWLMAIESAIAEDFDSVCENSGAVASRKNKQVRENLQAFHKYLCDQLGVDQGEVMSALPSFKEILGDILRNRG